MKKKYFSKLYINEINCRIYVLLMQLIATQIIPTVEVSCIFISSPTSILAYTCVLNFIVAYFWTSCGSTLASKRNHTRFEKSFLFLRCNHTPIDTFASPKCLKEITTKHKQMHTYIHRYDFQVIQPLKFICCSKEQGFKTTWST